ncbi:MAG: helix-turn-helix transcriptional regulator, partial [Bacteroidota bacterium]
MQLHRKLKALTNFSSSEFIRDIRLQRAADLLSNKGLHINEVAYSCGFNSPSYFAQCYKQKFGVSPSKVQVK